MPTWTDEEPRQTEDRERQPGTPREEPRNFETNVSDGDRNYNAPFDSDLEPIEDEEINTNGSER